MAITKQLLINVLICAQQELLLTSHLTCVKEIVIKQHTNKLLLLELTQ